MSESRSELRRRAIVHPVELANELADARAANAALTERLVGLSADVSRRDELIAELRSALTPFAEFAEYAVESDGEDGFVWVGTKHSHYGWETISDWLGPTAFGTARASLRSVESALPSSGVVGVGEAGS